MTKVCPICGKQFYAKYLRKIYCSKRCKWKAEYRNNRERRKEYARNYYYQHKEQISSKKHEWYLAKKLRKQIDSCKSKHDNCFNCPTENGECLYD